MNRLGGETSPYLRQHADNPVDWYPWGDEAFGRAKAEDKPVLLSVGYSACHWCHVMAHESFENDDVAKVMNELFVNIKVDREERPDVDAVYMEAVQAMTGQGGWPMTVVPTLDAMASGGIYDHLGGGFARYSVDPYWLVPHFEKMLYDQSGLGRAYLHGWQVTGEARYLQVLEETIAYVRRDLGAPGGAFYSAEDA